MQPLTMSIGGQLKTIVIDGGSTDGTILRMQLGIPIVTCGPGDRLIPHQVDEFVAADQVVEAARIYVASALNYLEAE